MTAGLLKTADSLLGVTSLLLKDKKNLLQKNQSKLTSLQVKLTQVKKAANRDLNLLMNLIDEINLFVGEVTEAVRNE